MTHKLLLLLTTLLLAASGRLAAQEPVVWPGDVTGNGRVNNVDLLYLGLAYNYIGPARSDANVQFEGQSAPAWNGSFPNGTNFAHADADGNGLINYYYDFFPLFVHYGLDRPGGVTPDAFTAGTPGFDPRLALVDTSIQNGVYPGASFKLPLVFGTPELPVEDVYGLAFSVSVDSSKIDARDIEFDLSENSWANPNNNRIFLQKAASPSRLDVAWVRTDHNNRSGHGRIGEASIIIIIDVIGLNQTTPVILHSLKMIHKFGNEYPVAGDTIDVKLLPNPLATGAQAPAPPALRLGPNPAHDYLRFEAADPVETLALYDALGRRVLTAAPQRTQGEVSLAGLPRGGYYAEIRTRNQVFLRAIQLE